ncbi:MAG TPA: PQQ-binding-like beta-propeller repeat protein [Gemmatales bacterium]|nr:PQQ-binding-like beta-propeller repeat protein [Gemmatales bacterium]HMP59588.1 PQQ-binding-like beta-propeller repeat protein [Gemmatales bacterium]
MIRHFALAALLAFIPWLAAEPNDWPQFRGADGTGVIANPYPTSWSGSEQVAWKVGLAGRGLSGPVVAAGKVFVTSCAGRQEDRLIVQCLDAATGKELWQRQLWATGSTACHPSSSMAAPTPVADAERVYALFATGDLACFSHAGDLLWYRALCQDVPTITNQVGMASSPMLADGMLIVPMENVGADSFAAGIDVRTGQTQWRVERPREENWTTPVVVRRPEGWEVLLLSGNNLAVLDAATGKEKWRYAAEGLSTIPSAIVGPDGILVPGGRAGELVLVRPSGDGQPAVAWRQRLRTRYATPLRLADKVYAITAADVLQCMNAQSGEVVWQLRLKNGPYAASPLAAGGLIYCLSEKGLCTVVRPGAEAEVVASNQIDDVFMATPALAGGHIFLRAERTLYCIGGR